MKKFIKKIIATIFVALSLVCVNFTARAYYVPYLPDGTPNVPYSEDAFFANLSINGFSVGNYWEAYNYDNAYNKLNFKEIEYSEKGTTNHYTTINDALLVSKYNSNIYAYIYKVTFTPFQVRKSGFFGIGSSGDNWYFRSLVSKCTLPNGYRMIEFSPKNTPESWSESSGGSFGVDSNGTVSAQISFGISYNVSELEIESQSNYLNQFKTTYSDKKISNYTKNASCYYGLFVFETLVGVKPNITVTHTGQYFGKAFYGIDNHGKVSFSRNLF